MLAISADALTELFSRRPKEGRKILSAVLTEYQRKANVRRISLRLILGQLKTRASKTSDAEEAESSNQMAEALRLQIAWEDKYMRVVNNELNLLKSGLAETASRPRRATAWSALIDEKDVHAAVRDDPAGTTQQVAPTATEVMREMRQSAVPGGGSSTRAEGSASLAEGSVSSFNKSGGIMDRIGVAGLDAKLDALNLRLDELTKTLEPSKPKSYTSSQFTRSLTRQRT